MSRDNKPPRTITNKDTLAAIKLLTKVESLGNQLATALHQPTNTNAIIYATKIANLQNQAIVLHHQIANFLNDLGNT